MLVRLLVRPLVGPHITSKTDYVAIASRRGERRGKQLMSKTGYIEIVRPWLPVLVFTEIVSFYGKWDILMCHGQIE
jgi:hypothetical protein